MGLGWGADQAQTDHLCHVSIVELLPMWGWGGVQIRRKLRSLEGLLQFRGNEQDISHTAHKLSIGTFALQTALDKVCPATPCEKLALAAAPPIPPWVRVIL